MTGEKVKVLQLLGFFPFEKGAIYLFMRQTQVVLNAGFTLMIQSLMRDNRNVKQSDGLKT